MPHPPSIKHEAHIDVVFQYHYKSSAHRATCLVGFHNLLERIRVWMSSGSYSALLTRATAHHQRRPIQTRIRVLLCVVGAVYKQRAINTKQYGRL